MKKILASTVVLMSSLCLSATAFAQTKEIRVLLANHPYGELLKAAIPDFEKQSGIKVNFESLQEGQLTTKLTTEFATKSSSVDVFMTRPLQEGKMFNRNGWYEPLTTQDFSDYPKNVMSVAAAGSAPFLVPLVTEWQVLYYRKDLFQAAGVEVPKTFTELEAAAKKLNSDTVAGIASRGKGAAAVTQLSSYVYNFGGQYIDKGVAVFDSAPAVEAIRYYGKLLGSYGPKGVTSMSWENIMPLFQAGKVAMWTDASVFYGQIVDPAKTQVPAANFGIANLPAGPKASSPFLVTSWGIAVAKQSKNKELAFKFLDWATSKELAAKGMLSNITMARSSVWKDPKVLESVNPGLVATRAYAAENGNPLDRPYMSAVGEARDQIGELVIESINTKGESANLAAMAKDKVGRVNDLLKDSGEYGQP
ncbi:sugar ABC transporter substrate-binding protein [Siculibacillus lacustris]|uniref:Sugar ABC transporter substrate-binding protein n=1 Tax=Siculibacillus lacustris TaxID=1549641 RepID=A0A4Q9VMZ0_9HYPH|nr:sugar ABC transporter substrate-binding protein [Siculibacillus lacustris]TBW36985.1 sugar ABC transporter substrate-binding protein [Siculibacillus lacustris]